MSEINFREPIRSDYSKDRLLTADLTDIEDMLDVGKISENVKRDPAVLAAMRVLIEEAEARIREWEAEGAEIDQNSLNLPDKIKREFGI